MYTYKVLHFNLFPKFLSTELNVSCYDAPKKKSIATGLKTHFQTNIKDPQTSPRQQQQQKTWINSDTIHVYGF